MVNQYNGKVDITQFHFSEKLNISEFFQELETIPVGEKDFDRRVLLLKVKHGLVTELSEEEMSRTLVRCWKSVN